jgi:hypothetical protein
MPDCSQIERRVHWASTVLAHTADELAELDPEASVAFARESERVADLRTVPIRDAERPPRTRSAALGRGATFIG